MTDFRALILKAAKEGRVTLSSIEGVLEGCEGAFESIEECLELSSDDEVEEICIDLGLIEDSGPCHGEICEQIHERNRQLARDNGIGRFGKYPR